MKSIADLVLLATEEGEASGVELVLPDMAELIWGLVGFAILMAIIVWKVWPAVNNLLEERQASIQGRLEEAERIRNEAEELRRQYESQLADARNRANEIVEEGRVDADRVREQRIAEAEEEARAIRQRAQADSEAERARLIQELRGQVAALSVELAGRIVHKELDEERHRELVDQYINELSGMS